MLFDGFLLYLFLLALIISHFAIIIQSGIYWGHIRYIFKFINNVNSLNLNKLPLYFLCSCILTIFVPIIAPLVTSSLVIHTTQKENCAFGKTTFLDQLMQGCLNTTENINNEELYLNFHSLMIKDNVGEIACNDILHNDWINNWFDDHCDKVNMYFWIWVALRIFCFGGLILVLIIGFIIAICPKRMNHHVCSRRKQKVSNKEY